MKVFCASETDTGNPMFAALSNDNRFNRQRAWLQCNDFVNGHIVGAPRNENTLVGRLTTAEFFIKQCELWFPRGPNRETFGASKGRTADTLNAYTSGQNPTKARHIIYSSGSRDVWREMGVAATRRPGGPMRSDPEKDIVVHVLESGCHHSERSTRIAELYQDIRRVHDLEVDQVCRWAQQWPGYSHY
ncbi:uncharacterized protein MYCGRDRAFT_40488 [Zymoseptoria tritici IPO323]|uniref:Uncharacterized protein n=1 Tax=Zymoseptoria tritici (strain CBS 115943 / IPO323) TaxID=336722 RepID=F9X840_ZYMTI|nr:uncharacterized protein MYCGRDRAFT_40488 [Zymoseptoria tritici IPO323]EGP88562.1 hypothetical protein MYCGRDRAFT_40488 [Zymoseptoria tritici IPO323]